MTDRPNRTASDALPRPAQMTRADRIQIVLDALRGTEDRPDLRQLQAELFQAKAAVPNVTQPTGRSGEDLTRPKDSRLHKKPSRPVVPTGGMKTTSAEQPASLEFLVNEHPAILAQQLLGQTEAERRRTLAACSGPLARQVRFLLADSQ